MMLDESSSPAFWKTLVKGAVEQQEFVHLPSELMRSARISPGFVEHLMSVSEV
jgi:hypothetical protein